MAEGVREKKPVVFFVLFRGEGGVAEINPEIRRRAEINDDDELNVYKPAHAVPWKDWTEINLR